ncbi:MAG: radical SAM family heme chaperone HemW [Gammaproteobacteria bacterium]|nr:radical SAM family heme chaperone HemW [Gammaproteobacteria bacterium]MDP2141547.1 radical SAM family heme chaperone HemW [Gammaproteobacteria bacterium]MDP2346908.1 radical SAM family heme chaperone HemW [Gammaproteobacteria bacterium]
MSATSLLHTPPLSLYVHIPWCVRKCPYCDFNSHQKNGELPEADYIAALLRDFADDLPYVQGREISTIFFGGGTPSLFSASAYETLFAGLQKCVRFAPDIEITLEANPGTAEREKFADYRRAGINRLSIGIQSFDDGQLQNLGRIHGSDDGRRAIEFARMAGFDNLNVDIMYGLKEQSLSSAMNDLQEAISYNPEHLSWYQLTIEPNTEFFKRPPTLPPEDELIEIQDSGLALLAQHGYVRYEVSAFARDERRARHNLNYWRFGDYLGIGAGAHGKITLAQTRRIVRTRKKKQPGHYLQAGLQIQLAADSSTLTDCFNAETAEITHEDIALEFMLNALRLAEGFTTVQFEAATGLGFEAVEKQVDSLQRKGLLSSDGGVIRPTHKGQQFLNSVLEEFV